MDSTKFTKRWFLTYSLLCASLLVCGSVSGQLADWSSEVYGGAGCDCDSQDNLLQPYCVAIRACVLKVKECNQGGGNGTKVCQTDAGGAACQDQRCQADNHDALSATCADGANCTPVQL